MTSVNIDIKHPKLREMFNQFHAELKRADRGYISGSFTNIGHANSELIALLEALIKKVRNNSTEKGMKQIVEDRRF